MDSEVDLYILADVKMLQWTEIYLRIYNWPSVSNLILSSFLVITENRNSSKLNSEEKNALDWRPQNLV